MQMFFGLFSIEDGFENLGFKGVGILFCISTYMGVSLCFYYAFMYFGGYYRGWL